MSAPGAAPLRYWLIYYEDRDKGVEIFTDETSARARLEEVRISWNCWLFAQVGEMR